MPEEIRWVRPRQSTTMTTDSQGPFHIARFAQESPGRPAVITGATGATLTYGDLDLRSRKLARYLSSRGLAKGDHIAVMMDNCADYFMVCWAAQRLGLIYTPINWHLAANESAYIIENCGAKALIVSENTRAVAQSIADTLHEVAVWLTTGTPFARFESINRIVESAADGPDVGQYEGNIMFYSSGTTGRPKGISHKLDEIPWGQLSPLAAYMRYVYAMGRDTVYLVPAPLYQRGGPWVERCWCAAGRRYGRGDGEIRTARGAAPGWWRRTG